MPLTETTRDAILNKSYTAKGEEISAPECTRMHKTAKIFR